MRRNGGQFIVDATMLNGSVLKAFPLFDFLFLITRP